MRAVGLLIRNMRRHHALVERRTCDLGIHHSQHRMLIALAKRQDNVPSQKELAEILGISAAAVTATLKKLEKEGYITRSMTDEDNRKNEIRITDMGISKLMEGRAIFESSGYEEMSLSSLSISDYTKVNELTDSLLSWSNPNMVSLSLPSLRADSFTRELMDKVASIRNSTITFAPEAGSQRLRDVINKNLYEEDLMRAVNVAFDVGKNQVKLYFMQGHPTETDEDLAEIPELAHRVVSAYYQNPNRRKGQHAQVTISVSPFIPKPFTPFQWEPQDTLEEMERKQAFVGSCVHDRRVKYNYHNAKTCHLEAVLARGDRRLAPALEEACRRGFKFEAWSEFFNYEGWMDIFATTGIDPAFYANRRYDLNEVLPWDIIDCGVTKAFLDSLPNQI